MWHCGFCGAEMKIREGTSGYYGMGTSGYSGYSGMGTSGYSGYSGMGTSGYSGYSGRRGHKNTPVYRATPNYIDIDGGGFLNCSVESPYIPPPTMRERALQFKKFLFRILSKID